MKFSIVGADKETGDNVEMTVEAASEAAAKEVAHRKGILVSKVASVVVAAPRPMASPPPAEPRRLEQGHVINAPVVNVALPRRGSSLGIAALVLGILAFLICWIPFVNLLGVPLAALGLLLGLIGVVVALTRSGAGIGFPIAGSAVCGISLVVAIMITGALVGGLGKAADELAAASKARNSTNQAPVTGTSTPGPADSAGGTSGSTRMPRPTPAPVVPPTPTVEWASAETPVRQGDVQVKIVSAKVGKVALRNSIRDQDSKSKDDLLSVALEISNLSETRKFDYRTWGGDAASIGSRTVLTDNFDNRYKVVNFGFAAEVKGAVSSESVYPGKSVTDVLVFEEPIGKVEFLNLELPAKQFGGEGMLRIRIPASMIDRQASRPDAP